MVKFSNQTSNTITTGVIGIRSSDCPSEPDLQSLKNDICDEEMYIRSASKIYRDNKSRYEEAIASHVIARDRMIAEYDSIAVSYDTNKTIKNADGATIVCMRRIIPKFMGCD